MIRIKMLAMSLAMGALALTPATAQDWGRRHGHDHGHGRRASVLRFDPGAMTLEVGQVGHFHIRLGRDDAHVHGIRLSASDECVRITDGGDGFDVSAAHEGTFRLIAEHGSGWRTARGEMILTVIRNDSLLSRIEILEAQSGRDLGDEVITLAPGQSIELRAVGFDQHGREMGIGPRWDLSGPAAGHFHQGRTGVTLVAGSTTCPNTVHTIYASDGNSTGTLRYRIFNGQAVGGLSRIDLVQVTRWGSQAVGGVIHANRGEQLTLQAVGMSFDGRPVRFEDRWSLSTSQLGHLHRGSDGSMVLHLDTAYRGTLVLVVRDAATGVGQQVQVVVN